MDDVRADIQEVAAGDAAGVLVGGMWSVAEASREGDSEVFSVFYVGKGLDVRGDEGHVYVYKVFGGCGDDGVDGFPVACAGWGQARWGRISGGVPEVAVPWVYVCFDGLFEVGEQLPGACIKKLVGRVTEVHDVTESGCFMVVLVR